MANQESSQPEVVDQSSQRKITIRTQNIKKRT